MKELSLNILDVAKNSTAAGASLVEISLELAEDGKRTLSIIDNGCGMDAEDLPVAIRRHATSKIRNAEDLDGICTLGFRGEALASISMVSRVELLTKRPDDDMGTLMKLELSAPNQRQALRLSKLLENKAQTIYNLTMTELLSDDEE